MKTLLSSMTAAAMVASLAFGFAAAPVALTMDGSSLSLGAPKAFAKKGADDAAGHTRQGRGADDPAGHVRGGHGADDAAGDDHGGKSGSKSGSSKSGSGKSGSGRSGSEHGSGHK